MEKIVINYDDIKPTFMGVEVSWKVDNYSYVKEGFIICSVLYKKEEKVFPFFSEKTKIREINYDIKSPCDGYLYIRGFQKFYLDGAGDTYTVWYEDPEDMYEYDDPIKEVPIQTNFDYDRPNNDVETLATYELNTENPIAFIGDSLYDIFSLKYSHSGSELIIDPFDKTKEIMLSNNITLSSFSLGFSNDTALLYYYSKRKLQKGDSISFLFDNGEIIDFVLFDSPLRNEWKEKRFKRTSYKNEYRAAFTLYKEDVDLLLNSKLICYRITDNNSGKTYDTNIEDEDYQYEKIEYNAYVNEFLKTLHELVPEYHLPCRTVKQTQEKYVFDWCYVYLMRDNINGYYKIGMSDNPKYREKTLQSEKPSIELIASKKFPTRKIAKSIESALHTAYSQQRIRGEWFKLNDQDVAAIIETLK